MKPTITIRYVAWLVLFMLFFVVVIFSVDIAYGLIKEHETLVWKTEITELLWFVTVTLAMMPVVIAAGWRVARKMLKPVRQIADTAEQIASGILDARIPVANPADETGRLAVSINRAFDKYDDAVGRLQRFNANASHQLRTPLTAIRSKGEVTLGKPRSSEDYRSAIADMLEQTTRLSRTVEQILNLSKLETSAWRARFTKVALTEILQFTAAEFSPLLESRDIHLQIKAVPGIRILGNESLMEEVFANLLDNAVRFTPPSGTIAMEIRIENHSRAVVIISDTGPGIPEPQREKVFERFEKGTHPEHDGAGLGLSIVAEIVHLHNGRVEARPNPAGGTAIYMEFPALP